MTSLVLVAYVSLVAPATAAADSSPAEVYDIHLSVDIPVTVVAGSVALVRVLFADRLARKSCPCDPATLNSLDRRVVGNHNHLASVAADVTVYGGMAALPLLDLTDLGFSRALGEDLMVFAETLAVDTALQNAVNFAVSRPRPSTYAGDPASVTHAEGYLSFYAGHVSTAFAMMSTAAFTLQERHGARVWPWMLTALVGSSVAVERVASGHHFPTDVAVAALAGTAIGVSVPWLHLRHRESRLSVVPLFLSSGQGVGVSGAL